VTSTITDQKPCADSAPIITRPGQDGKARLVQLELHVLVNDHKNNTQDIGETMSDPERNQIVYVTANSEQWVIINIPFGLISPPTIDLHLPQVGSVTFYHASGHKLPVPEVVADLV
jgi:hypothetical protein